MQAQTSNQPCTLPFLNQLATDLGISETDRLTIAAKGLATEIYYQSLSSDASLGDLAQQGENCVLQTLNTTSNILVDSFRTFVLACVVVIFIVGMGIFFLYFYGASWMVILLCSVLALLALLVTLFLLYRATRAELETEAQNFERCLAQTGQALNNYTSKQNSALQQAFCFYASL